MRRCGPIGLPPLSEAYGPNVTGFWASFSLSSDPPFLQLHLHGFVLLTYLVLGGDSPRPPIPTAPPFSPGTELA